MRTIIFLISAAGQFRWGGGSLKCNESEQMVIQRMNSLTAKYTDLAEKK
jgi:hypothetical protein